MRILILFLAFVLAAPVYSQNLLNGMSPYKYLNREFYIAALYTEEPIKDADTLVSSQKPMKMVMRVSVKRWKPKTFAKMQLPFK